MDRKICYGGWARLEGDLSPETIKSLKDKLTITQRPTSEYSEPHTLRLYEEGDGFFNIPRRFPWLFKFERAGFETRDETVSPIAVNLKKENSVIVLREEQKQALEKFKQEFNSGSLGAILEAPPGWGKTVFALKLIAEIGLKTLIVVHKEFLMNQWRERIEQFLPGASVGIIQQDVCEVNHDIVLGMVQSLAMKEYPPEAYQFGVVATDEVHRISSPLWSTTIPKFPARFRIGVSATPFRKDGTDAVFKWHIGSVIFRAKEARLVPKVKRVKTPFYLVKTPASNPNELPKFVLMRKLAKSERRNKLIVDKIKEAVNAGRKIIVFSDRLEHLKTLEGMYRASGGEVATTDFYIGGRKEEDLKKAEGAKVIFATFQMASEGLDISSLDTAFLTTPKADVKQATGRILRPFEGKKDPIIVDFIDDEGIAVFKDLYERRCKFYSGLTK